MELIIALTISIASGVVGIAVGWFLRFIIALGKRGSMEIEIKEMMLEARQEADTIKKDAEEEADEFLKTAKEEIKKEEDRLQKTEDRLIKKENLLDNRQIDLDQNSEDLKSKEEEVEKSKNILAEISKQKQVELQKISGLDPNDAKQILLNELQNDYEEDLKIRIQKLEQFNKEKLDNKAREIITTAIQRLSVSVSSDNFTTNIELPSDEIKGKIIGKEGRNIKAFERETGVELIIDDTPGTITLSSYDPVRREIAKIALKNLIDDGIIQPAKIE